ncbi:MAG: sensor histidine kinase [Thermoanaerobaculia bacterium]
MADEPARSEVARTLGLRREVSLFMPAALAVLLVLSVATLLLYRQATAAQLGARRAEVSALARLAAEAVAADDEEKLSALQRASGATVTVVSARGAIVIGEEPLGAPPISAEALARVDGPVTLGPDKVFSDRIVALAPLGPAAGPDAPAAARRYVRIDRPLPALAAEWRRLKVLTPLVLGVDAVLAALVLLFLRHAFRPWRELVRRAEEAGMGASGDDEVAVLTRTFERALKREQADRERLAEGLARLGEMAAGVAHELRNGLAALSGYLEMIERRAEAAPEPAHLAALRRECRHLERVVGDFLSFAHPGTTRLAEVSLSELVRQVLAAPGLQAAQLHVDDRTDGTATLLADVHLLQRALTNLVANALEAGPAGGAVRIALEREGSEWIVAVEDRGPGIPDPVRERLFQPFVSGRPGGTGLGLPLAQRIAGLHGGRIELRDRADGGTRAELRLPVGNFG